MGRNRLGFFGLALLLMALLVACAPAAVPTPTPTKPPVAVATPTPAPPKVVAPTPTPAPPKPPIKIGHPNSLTGPYSSLAKDQNDGFLLYLEEKGHTIAGRKIEVIYEDDETKPDVGVTKAKKLVERDGVQMLVGILMSHVALAIADYAVAQKVPLLITNAGADGLTKGKASPYIFRSSFSNSQNTHAVGEWAYKKGYRKAVVMGADYAAGWDHAGGFAHTFTLAGGRVLQELYPPLGAPDFAPFITTIKTDADVVFIFGPEADALRFVKQYAEYGLKAKIPLLGGWLTTEDILPKLGDDALGIVNGYPFVPTMDRPQAQTFVAAFEKRFKRPATPQAEFGYSGAMVVAAALEAVKGNIEDKEAFIKAMAKVEVEAPRGRIKFDTYQGVIHDVYITEVKKVDGKLVNVIFDKATGVSQFWKWSPEEFLKMPTYTEMKGKWVK